LTDTTVTVALEAGIEARAKPVKYNRLFNNSQEKSRKLKQLKKNVGRVDLSAEEDKHFRIECTKPYSIYRALQICPVMLCL
jgi:hypothetical protein